MGPAGIRILRRVCPQLAACVVALYLEPPGSPVPASKDSLFTVCTLKHTTLMPSLEAGHQSATGAQTQIAHLILCGAFSYSEKGGKPQEVGCRNSCTFNWWEDVPSGRHRLVGAMNDELAMRTCRNSLKKSACSSKVNPQDFLSVISILGTDSSAPQNIKPSTDTHNARHNC